MIASVVMGLAPQSQIQVLRDANYKIYSPELITMISLSTKGHQAGVLTMNELVVIFMCRCSNNSQRDYCEMQEAANNWLHCRYFFSSNSSSGMYLFCLKVTNGDY